MYKLLALIILSVSLLSCNGQQNIKQHASMNKLKYSSSPYLQQHAHNPVHWQEWGPDALDMAKKLNKPLIISIGYAACHWCHVMEHESFSDNEVAAFMNDNFICIKVDREERPDIDQVYMEAVQLISGRGGWPLNAFALPDGRPFFAGTYFDKQKWMEVMGQINDLYNSDYSKVVEYAEELTKGINQNPIDVRSQTDELAFSMDDYISLKNQWLKNIDFKDGGFKRAPKFPLPVAWEFLLEYYYYTDDLEALNAVELLLNKMAMGGIYDQIGGGFARYSVDEKWEVPHFEKMLYDNAQLISLYSHAYQITKTKRYGEIIDQTIGFINRELSDKNGGFYSSINADSEGEEGVFYVWSYDDMVTALNSKNIELITNYYQITRNGNWEEGKNILLPVSKKKKFAENNGLSIEEFDSILNEANDALFIKRSERIRPTTDDKILTSWNSMMITSLIDAFHAVNNADYLKLAIRNSNFIRDNMLQQDGSLLRNYMNGKSGIDAFLDDYALYAQACINLYSATFDKQWLDIAKNLSDYCIKHFYNSESRMFYYTSNLSEELVARKYEIPDNVIPSSNSIIAKVLYKLGHYYDDTEYLNICEQMLVNETTNIMRSAIWYSNWASLGGLYANGITEVAITGKNAVQYSNEVQDNYLPASIFLGGNSENLPLLKNKTGNTETTYYVCKDKVCDLPVYNVNETLLRIYASKIDSK